MASSGGKPCGVCEFQHVAKKAQYWCFECDEGLCSDCLTHHASSKSTRNHEVISIGRYLELPASITNIRKYCTDHEKEYKLYCPQHEALCCPSCISISHKGCHNLRDLDDVIKTSKSSTLLDDLSQTLKDIEANLEMVIKDRTRNLEIVKKQRMEFEEKIKLTRDKINKYLDELEQNTCKDLLAAEKNIQFRIESYTGKLNDRITNVRMHQERISSIKSYASDLQTFLGSKEIQKNVESEEKFVKGLSEDENLQQYHIKCSIEDKMLNITSFVTEFGLVSVEASRPSVVIKSEKDKQAQFIILQTPRRKDINDIKLTCKGKMTIPGAAQITGCTILTSGTMVFTDCINHRIVIIQKDYRIHNTISVTSYPSDVTSITENTVAVTVGGPNRIDIVNVVSRSVDKSIHTNNPCYGIAYTPGMLMFCEVGKGINAVQLSDYGITTIVKKPSMTILNFLTIHGDKIYSTDYARSTVTCYSKEGQQIWVFMDKALLKCSFGITVDDYSNIYVASQNNNRIIVISPDGKQGKMVLCETDNLNQPSVVHFSATTNTLLVADGRSDVLIFQQN